MRTKQLSALTFCAATVPAIMILPQAGWLWAGLAATGSAVALCFAQRHSYSAPVLRKAMFAWNLLVLGAATRLLCNAFANGSALLGLLLLLLASYAAAKGRNVLLRVGGVCMFLLIIVYSVLLGFSLPELPSGQLAPKTELLTWSVLPAALTPLLALQLRKENETVHPFWLLGFVVFTVLTALVSGKFDFYSAMKSVSVMDVMQRLEPLVSVALTIGGFCLLGTICAANETLIAQLYPQKKNFAMPLNFIIGGVGLWLSSLLGSTFFAVGTAIFWGGLPLLAQLLEKSKKFKKNQKNA